MNPNRSENVLIITNERLLKPREVAERLSLSQSKTYQLLQTGEIPSVRFGRACRVRPADLIEYIERNIHSQFDSK